MNELIPKIKPIAPKSLKGNIINQIKKESKMTKFKHFAAAAAVLVAVIFVPLVSTNGSQAKAMTLLNESISKVEGLKTMLVKFLVRTPSQDNFDYIDINENFVEHTIIESFENQPIFRIEKPQRVAIFDGKTSFLWIKTTDEVREDKGIAGIFGDLNNLLIEPKTLLENAQKSAKSKGAKVDLKETENQITLTIEARAQGDFSQSDYTRNSTITESDNKQIYVFDKETKLLQGLDISIFDGKRYVTILKTTSIEYNVPVNKNALVALPENLVHKPLLPNDLSNISENITAEQAVKNALNSLKISDISQYETFFSQYPTDMIKKEFYGLEILKIGKSFKSGTYVGKFVPIEVRLPDGKIQKTNLAVRNDNEAKVWILDGGI
ncbi:MAG: hypothetical protein LBV75_03415 [Paludibacter sp.]|jgi:hypothetical protein|nr:hypothetical protein [Paludibacter sp.]